MRPPAGSPANWSNKHRVASTTREKRHGSITTIDLTLSNGTSSIPQPDPLPDLHPSSMYLHHPPPPPHTITHPPNHPQPSHPTLPPTFHHNPAQGQLPKMRFPKFDGGNPQLWITHGQNYFEMYWVNPTVWIKCSTMQFTGTTKRWL